MLSVLPLAGGCAPRFDGGMIDDTMTAEVCLPTSDLTGDLGFFGRVLGMRMLSIFPADDPAVAVFAGHGLLRRGSGDPVRTRHDADIHFTFVMAGTLRLEAEGHPPRDLATGDAFVIPPDLAVRYAMPSADIELLEVTLPGHFETLV